VRMMIQALACSLALTFHQIVVDSENSLEAASTWKERIPSHQHLHRTYRKSIIAVKVVLPWPGPEDEGQRGWDVIAEQE
jgi:hypothetical protein